MPEKLNAMDSAKLVFECFKHFTTLDTASILVTVTLVDHGVLNATGWPLICVLSLFIASLMASLFVMATIADGPNESSPFEKVGTTTAVIVAPFLFCAGAAMLGVLSLRVSQ
jgi:hypothetical protein